MSLESDTFKFTLFRYYGRKYPKMAAKAIGIPLYRITRMANGDIKIPVYIWNRVAGLAENAAHYKRLWVEKRKARLDIWLSNQLDYIESAKLSARSQAENARKARASRKGNHLKTGEGA